MFIEQKHVENDNEELSEIKSKKENKTVIWFQGNVFVSCTLSRVVHKLWKTGFPQVFFNLVRPAVTLFLLEHF